MIKTRQVAQEQPGIAARVTVDLQAQRQLTLHMGKTDDFEDPHRITLLGYPQALAATVPGQPLEALVAVAPQPQRQLLQAVGIEQAGMFIDKHLDQALLTLIGNHENTRLDVLDGFRITKAT